MNYNYFSSIYTEESQFSREKLQFFFDKAFQKTDETSLRTQYKALRDLEFSSSANQISETVDISSLCENLTSAFDVFASVSGMSFIFCGNRTATVQGNYRLITKAFLNLLSNAYLYGSTNLVTVKVLETQNHIRVEVQSGGKIPFSISFGKGLSFVQRICSNMDGRFLIESNQDSTKAIMCFKRQDAQCTSYDTKYDFLNLLSDRLSPVYVEIFGMCYH